MLKICFFVPSSHLESVKLALFSAGAGRLGGYEHCCWQTLGQGQYRPCEGSKPYIGEVDQIHYLEEYKVEMLCEPALIAQVIRALKQVHPYEVPAYEVFQMLDF
jgi:hypothetical protein